MYIPPGIRFFKKVKSLRSMFTYRNSAYKLTLLFFVVNKIDAKKQNN